MTQHLADGSSGSSTPENNYTLRSAADVSRLVNNSTHARSNARIIVAIALGGVFLDAYDLGALAFGVKDITRQFGLSPEGIGMVVSAITLGAIVGAVIGVISPIKSAVTVCLWPICFSLCLPPCWERWHRMPKSLASAALLWGWGLVSTYRSLWPFWPNSRG